MVAWKKLSEEEFHDFMDNMLHIVADELLEKHYDIDYKEMQNVYDSPLELVKDILKEFRNEVDKIPSLQTSEWHPDEN